MKTFIKILIGFALGFVSGFGLIAWAIGAVQMEPDKHRHAAETVAEWVRRMGYDVKEPEENNFKMGFH